MSHPADDPAVLASARARDPFDPPSLVASPRASEPVLLVQRLRRAVPGLAVALVALLLAWPSPRPAAPRRIPCVRAGLVDGRLRCDDELPAAPAALCPGRAFPGSRALVVAGDAFDTAQLCARSFASPHEPGSGWDRMPPDELAMLRQPVDLNEASLAELESLPRVGPKLARRIVEGRPYTSVDALDEVRGIGPATLLQLRDRAVVDPRASWNP